MKKNNTKKCVIWIGCFIIIYILFTQTRIKFIEGLDVNAVSNQIGKSIANILTNSGVDDVGKSMKIFTDDMAKITDNIKKTGNTPNLKTSIETIDLARSTPTADGCNTGNSVPNTPSLFDGFAPSTDFCAKIDEEKCSQFGENECISTSCCVWTAGEKCVRGNIDGPTTRLIDTDYSYYSFDHKCRGLCGDNNNPYSDPCSSYRSTDKNISEACIKKLWSKSKCTNVSYITTDLVNDLSLNTKEEITDKFAEYNNRNESKYADCYGGDVTKWASCDALPKNHKYLSKRCIDKFWYDARCTNLNYIDATRVNDLSLNTKEFIQDLFKVKKIPKQEDPTDCYGGDVTKWPACDSIPDTESGISRRCMMNFFTDASCNSAAATAFITDQYVTAYATSTKRELKERFKTIYTQATAVPTVATVAANAQAKTQCGV